MAQNRQLGAWPHTQQNLVVLKRVWSERLRGKTVSMSAIVDRLVMEELRRIDPGLVNGPHPDLVGDASLGLAPDTVRRGRPSGHGILTDEDVARIRATYGDSGLAKPKALILATDEHGMTAEIDPEEYMREIARGQREEGDTE